MKAKSTSPILRAAISVNLAVLICFTGTSFALGQSTAKATSAPTAKKTIQGAQYRVLTQEDGLSCHFSQDLSVSVSPNLSGNVTATRNHFVCTNEEGKEISIEPKSVEPVDGKVEIKTEDIGTIRMDTEEGSFDKYEMTESQIAKLKKMLESSVTISSSEAEKLLLENTLPVYPPIARAAHVQGIVVLRVMISKDGMVENLSVVSGNPMLTGAASNAVKTWRYKPYLSHGKPMEVETNVSVTFAYP